MHKATLIAGIVIVVVVPSVFYFSAAFSNLGFCAQSIDIPSPFESYMICNPVNFAPHILSFALGIWLMIFGVISGSAKPILTQVAACSTPRVAQCEAW